MNGSERIAAERRRQIDAEGYTPEHDAQHDDRSLTEAAWAYVWYSWRQRGGVSVYLDRTPELWPWEDESWKPSHDPVRNLEKAGALIAAEIDRLDGTEAP